MSHRRKSKRRTTQPARPLVIVAGGAALIGIAALLIFGGGSGDATSSPITPEVNGAPGLKVDREKVDLGNVRLGRWVNVSFEIANAGNQALRFVEVPYVEVVKGC